MRGGASTSCFSAYATIATARTPSAVAVVLTLFLFAHGQNPFDLRRMRVPSPALAEAGLSREPPLWLFHRPTNRIQVRLVPLVFPRSALRFVGARLGPLRLHALHAPLSALCELVRLHLLRLTCSDGPECALRGRVGIEQVRSLDLELDLVVRLINDNGFTKECTARSLGLGESDERPGFGVELAAFFALQPAATRQTNST